MAGKTCKIMDCVDAVQAVGLCANHYYRLGAYGDPLRCVFLRKGSVKERLFMRVAVSGECWEFNGKVERKGYGRMMVNGVRKQVYTISFELHHGRPITPGLCIDHLCRNKRCVRPDHLEEVTNRENILRGIRFRKGIL